MLEMNMFFNAQHLPPPVEAYVAWIDLMGMKSMSAHLNLSRVANHAARLHIAAKIAWNRANLVGAGNAKLLKVLPIMDGVFLFTDSKECLESFLTTMMAKLFECFKEQRDPRNRFLVRGGLSFGRLTFCENVPQEASRDLSGWEQYPGLFLGLPIVRAFEAEAKACPFGIFIDELAREFAPSPAAPLVTSRYEWWSSTGQLEEIRNGVLDHYKWIKGNAKLLGYAEDDLNRHVELVRGFLAPGVVNLVE